MSEDEFFARLANSRKQSYEGKTIDAKKAINDIKEKYEL